MAGLSIYIDDKDLKKAQKGYSWTDAQKTTTKETKPQGKYNVVATDKAYMTTQQPKSFQEVVVNEPVYDKVAKAIFPAEPSNGIIRDEKGNMLGEQPIEPLYGFKDPVFNLAFLGAGLANGAMKGITEIGEKVVTNKPLWTAISANNIKNRIEDEGFVEGVLGHPVQTTFDLLMLGPAAKGIKTVGNEAIKMHSHKIITPQKIKSSISHKEQSWTPEQWTAAQDAAIESGDITEAQRLRDLHFKVNAPNTKAVDLEGKPLQTTHGTNKTFNSFELEGPNVEHGDPGDFGYGHYFFPDKRISSYGDRQIYSYLNIENPYKGEWSRNFNRGQSGLDYAKKSMKSARDFGLTNMTDLEIEQELSKLSNADGVFAISPYNKRIQEIVVPKGEQIKLADAVTYDDNGVRIPLGLRDNFKLNDIRYGLTTLGTTGLGLGLGYKFLNNQKKQTGGEQENIDNTHLWKRTHWGEVDKSPTGNPLWGDKYEINNFDKYDRKKYLELKKQIREEYPNAIFHYTRSKDGDMYVDSFRVPYEKQEDVALPKIDNKWNTVVTLPNGQEERQMMALVPEKRTNYIDGYRTTKNGIQNMINFTDPWTLPKWTMAFENASGKPYSDRYYQLQNEYFDNGGKDNPLEYILNKDFDEVKTTGELETLNIPNALWYNTTKRTFMVSDENGNLNYSDYNLSPNDHYSVTDNVKIYKPKQNTITTIDQNAVKRNKFIKEMNDVNRLANMVNAGHNRTWNLQYQQGGPTHLQPWDEQRFRMWFNSLPEGIRNSNDYDYRGWWLENGSIPYKQILSGNGHFTDKYKLPNHPTFSNQSIYSKGNTIGGKWINNDMDFVPSQYNVRNGSDRIVDYMEFGDKGSRMFDTNGMVAQFKDGGPLGLTIVIDDEQFKKGGQIHIKKKNKGKFTKQAQSAGMSVQEFARHVLAHKDRYPASTVKRANFARNASKWGK